MKKHMALTTALASFAVLGLAAQSPTIAEMNSRLRAEETNNSKLMWIMHEISDVHGPRLTGSPGLRAAQDWAVATMKSWGLANVKLEPWNFNHQGWQNYELQANVLTPFQQPLNVRAVSWTPGTNGTVEGPVLVVVPPAPPGGGRGRGGFGGRGGGASSADIEAIAQAGTSPPPMPEPPAASTDPVTQAVLDAYLASIKPKVKGAIVFYGPHVEVAENFVPAPLRRPEEQWENTGRGGGRRGGFPQRGGGGGRGAAPQNPGLTAGEIAQQVNTFLIDNGALVKVTDSGRPYGVIVQQSTAGYNENPDSKNLPSLVMGNEDYGRIYRTATIDKVPITMRVNIRNEFYPEGKTVYNVTGELPGTDKADEVVMIGGHFDSWNPATGATDNGAGSTDALEAIRLLKAVGATPRRTIRVALWSGEEQGLYRIDRLRRAALRQRGASQARVRQVQRLPEHRRRHGQAARRQRVRSAGSRLDGAGSDVALHGLGLPPRQPDAGPQHRRHRQHVVQQRRPAGHRLQPGFVRLQHVHAPHELRHVRAHLRARHARGRGRRSAARLRARHGGPDAPALLGLDDAPGPAGAAGPRRRRPCRQRAGDARAPGVRPAACGGRDAAGARDRMHRRAAGRLGTSGRRPIIHRTRARQRHRP